MPCGPNPGIDGDLLFLPLAQAAVIGDADVLLQLEDLTEHMRAELRPGLCNSAARCQLTLKQKVILSSCVI